MARFRRVIERNNKTHTHIVVHKDTHLSIKAFAAIKDTTIVDATQYLIEQGFKAVYKEKEDEECD